MITPYDSDINECQAVLDGRLINSRFTASSPEEMSSCLQSLLHRREGWRLGYIAGLTDALREENREQEHIAGAQEGDQL